MSVFDLSTYQAKLLETFGPQGVEHIGYALGLGFDANDLGVAIYARDHMTEAERAQLINSEASKAFMGEKISQRLDDIESNAPSFVPKHSSSRFDSLRDFFDELGATSEQAANHHWLVGPTSAHGYNVDTETSITFPDDHSMHKEARTEGWSVTIWPSETEFYRASVRLHYYVPGRYVISLTLYSQERVSGPWFVSSEVGLDHIQSVPFELHVGSPFRMVSISENNMFPLRVTSTDPSVPFDFVLDGDDAHPYDLNAGAEDDGAVRYAFPHLTIRGSGGSAWFEHWWEYKTVIPGYSSRWGVRLIDVWDNESDPVQLASRLSGRVYLPTEHVIYWIVHGSPRSQDEDPYDTHYELEVVDPHGTVHTFENNNEFTLTQGSWATLSDGHEYPKKVTLTIPKYGADLRFDVQLREIPVTTTGDWIEPQGRATVTGTWLTKTVNTSDAFVESTTHADQKETLAFVSNLYGMNDYVNQFLWPKATARERGVSFFLLLIPVVLLALLAFIFGYLLYLRRSK